MSYYILLQGGAETSYTIPSLSLFLSLFCARAPTPPVAFSPDRTRDAHLRFSFLVSRIRMKTLQPPPPPPRRIIIRPCRLTPNELVGESGGIECKTDGEVGSDFAVRSILWGAKNDCGCG